MRADNKKDLILNLKILRGQLNILIDELTNNLVSSTQEKNLLRNITLDLRETYKSYYLNKKDVGDKCKVECLGCGKIIESTYSNINTLCEECYRDFQKIITEFNVSKKIEVNGINTNSNINKNIKYEIKGSVDNE